MAGVGFDTHNLRVMSPVKIAFFYPAARLARLERAAYAFGGHCSIQLSYKRRKRTAGVEPAYSAWKADARPISQARIK